MNIINIMVILGVVNAYLIISREIIKRVYRYNLKRKGLREITIQVPIDWETYDQWIERLYREFQEQQ